MVVEVLRCVARPYTAEDGVVVHDAILPGLERGEIVTVSFEGANAVSTSFVNCAFIELLERFDFAFIKAHLRVVKSTGQINRMIKQRFYFEVNRRQPPHAAE